MFETFGQQEAQQFLGRVKFIYTHKHGCWLNIPEIETNIVDLQCTAGRIANKENPIVNLAVWTNSGIEKRAKYSDHL